MADEEKVVEETQPAEDAQATTEDDNFGAGIFENGEGEQAAPTEPAQPSQEETVAAASSGFVETLTELGFDNVDSDEVGRDRLLEAYRQERQRQSDLERRAMQAEQLASFYAQQQSLPQQPAATATDESSEENTVWPTYPQYDPQMVSKYRQQVADEQGNVVSQWAAETPPEVRAAYDQSMHAMENWTHNLAWRPQETLEPIMRKVTRDEVVEVLRDTFGIDPQELPQRLDINGDRAYATAFREQYQDKLVERDARTGQVIGFNDLGNRFNETLLSLEQDGITSLPARFERAKQIHAADFAALESQTQSATAAEVREERKKQKQQRGRSSAIPNRTGSVPRSEEEVQNDGLTAGQRLVAEMEAEGMFAS